MKIGLTFFPTRPQFMVPMAKRADELGFESIWVPEHLVFPTKVTSQYPYNPEAGPPFPTTPLFDPLIALTYVAAVTSRVWASSAPGSCHWVIACMSTTQ